MYRRNLTKMEWLFLTIVIVCTSLAIAFIIMRPYSPNYTQKQEMYIKQCNGGFETLVYRNDEGKVIINCKYNSINFIR
jgi:capsular polysaccharide biosynthesis protein